MTKDSCAAPQILNQIGPYSRYNKSGCPQCTERSPLPY
jgi:hypothetical protein